MTYTPPFFRIAAPPEYENKTTLEVFRTFDSTDETLRNTYQDLILEENAPTTYLCMKNDGVIVSVSIVRSSLSEKLNYTNSGLYEKSYIQ